MQTRFERIGVLAAVVLAVSAFAFFGAAGAMTKAHPVLEPEQFLSDAVARHALADVWAWSQLWLGIWTVPFYLALHERLRAGAEGPMRVALVTGILWGVMLITLTPVLVTVFDSVGPAWAREPNGPVRAGLLHTASTLLQVGATQVTIVFFLRAISIACAGVAMLARGGGFTWLGWLGVAFGVEHVVAGVCHQALGTGGVNSVFGAAGGLMLFVWLLGTARELLPGRLESVTQS